ncbi:coproporphyrinogen-III oxidase family protein [Granulicella tundricola]|uniref:coproporphyrinogen-III oxidase family protein n=1 Tax=Granulicella tundricola TaxID=940615 RepID=UPI001E496C4A|nr:coproporphyrinogen-III oxidase family protein [Granulicella tundricola]
MGSEITVECAPGQMSSATLDAFLAAGMNRVSFGVQSFVDRESAAVGRTHTRVECLGEIQRFMAAGVSRLGIDLICGLPGQTLDSWRESVQVAVGSGVEHVSVYMLEVDEDSRLGREKIAGGGRYGAGELPDEDAVADWYAMGAEWLEAAGVRQYEISNFARVGGESAHNLKYWRREEYLGFGLDAHSMLRDGLGGVRWANADSMGEYMGAGLPGEGFARTVDRVGVDEGFEETLFLGLREVRGVDLRAVEREFGRVVELDDVVEAGLVVRDGTWVRLSERGRMVSNEVFERLLVVGV